jgi:hypothetical protein
MIQKLRAFHWSSNVHSTHCSILFHCTLHIYSIKFTQLLSVSSIAARVVKLSGVPSRHGLTRPTLAHWRCSTVSAHHVGRNAGLDDEPWPYPRPIAFPVLMRQCLSQNMVISLHKHKCHIDHKDIRNVKVPLFDRFSQISPVRAVINCPLHISISNLCSHPCF